MADEVDRKFLGEQISRLQADMRELKTRTARTDADVLALSEALSERLDTLERRVDSGFAVVDQRFEHVSEHLLRHDREFAVIRTELAEMRGEMTRNLEIVLTAIPQARE